MCVCVWGGGDGVGVVCEMGIGVSLSLLGTTCDCCILGYLLPLNCFTSLDVELNSYVFMVLNGIILLDL